MQRLPVLEQNDTEVLLHLMDVAPTLNASARLFAPLDRILNDALAPLATDLGPLRDPVLKMRGRLHGNNYTWRIAEWQLSRVGVA